jgi:hypothetical protein
MYKFGADQMPYPPTNWTEDQRFSAPGMESIFSGVAPFGIDHE